MIEIEALEEVLIEVRILVDIGILVIVEVEVFETRESAKSSKSLPLYEVRPLSEKFKFSRLPIEAAESVENIVNGTKTLELIEQEFFVVVCIVILVDVVVLVVIDILVEGGDTKVIETAKSLRSCHGKSGKGSKDSKKRSSELHCDIWRYVNV